MSTHPTLRLLTREDRRLRAGHPWVFSNEVDVARTALKTLAPGTLVELQDGRGERLGLAHANPGTLIAARLLTRNPEARIGRDWLAARLKTALDLRIRRYGPEGARFCRLAFAESDGLPGLVVDRFDTVCVVQLTTAGMESLKDDLLDALETVLPDLEGVRFANRLTARALEGLPNTEDETYGEFPATVEVPEHGARFLVPVDGGQKTGWFYDQRDNRAWLAWLAPGAEVLDAFSYLGGWGVGARVAGAKSALCVDSSAPALAGVEASAALSGTDGVTTLKADALDAMKTLKAEGKSFDVVICDPPALVKQKKDHAAGAEHYAALERAALALVRPGGWLVACSCSYHLAEEDFTRLLLREARRAGRNLSIVVRGGQAADHPVHPAMPETRYLKALACRVL